MADAKFSFQEVGRIYEPAWMSPEALSKRPADINHEASDMWSFAVLLWELATREVPFADLSPMECGMKVGAQCIIYYFKKEIMIKVFFLSPSNFDKKVPYRIVSHSDLQFNLNIKLSADNLF